MSDVEQMPPPHPRRRNDDHLVEIIAERLEAVREDLGDMKAALNRLTDAVSRMALVEERQSQITQAQAQTVRLLEKIEHKVDTLAARVTALEIADPMQRQTSKWFLAGIWGVVGAAATAVGAQITKHWG